MVQPSVRFNAICLYLVPLSKYSKMLIENCQHFLPLTPKKYVIDYTDETWVASFLSAAQIRKNTKGIADYSELMSIIQ